MALSRPTQLNDLFQDVALVNPQLGEVLTRGATHWTNGAATVGATGGPVNPKDYGAIGDATVHQLSAQDILDHPEWLGTYTTAHTWDDVGIQEAIYAAYGGPGEEHGLDTNRLNRELYIPGGDYRLKRTLILENCIGVIFAGAGRFSTILTMLTVDTPILNTTMVYSVIRDIDFQYLGGPCSVPTALVEWDWNQSGGQPSAAGLAQLSIYDCIFQGGGWAKTVGFRAALHQYQGDNVVFHNCFFASCFYAGFMTGEGAANALNIVFDTCNFQRCLNHGILMFQGNIICIAGSFQNSQLGAPEKQVGFDIMLISSANSASVISGCRSESARFLHADSSHAVGVRECDIITSPPWWLPNTAYNVGDIRIAHPLEEMRDGRPYVCCQAGTSGATEPDWAASYAGHVGLVDDYCVWTLYGVAQGGTPEWVHGTLYAVGDIRKGKAAGNFDGNEYICVVAGYSAVISAEPVWNAVEGFTDGTAKWVLYNYLVLEFDAGTVENCSMPYGQTKVGSVTPCRLINNVFSRDDWLWQPPGVDNALGGVRHHNLFCGNLVTHAAGINNGTPVPYRIPSFGAPSDDYPDHLEAYSHFYLPNTTPLVWARKTLTANRASRDVGFWPPAGFQADASNTDLSQNVVGLIGALAPRHAEGTDVAGADTLIQGGLGTGTGVSGQVRVRTAAGGSAGSTVNNPVAALDALSISHARIQSGLVSRLLPLTLTQRDALTGLYPGDEIWNVTHARKQVWNGFTWEDASTGVITWDPTEFGADLQAWWTLDDPATLFQSSGLTTPAVADNDPLGGIADKSGNSRPLLQATAGARPLLKLDSAAGLPVARCDGVDNFLQTAAFDRFPVPNTVVLVFRNYTTGGYIVCPANNAVGYLSQSSLGDQFIFVHGTNMSISGDAATQFGTAILTYAEADSEAWLNGTRFATALTAGGLPAGLTIGALYNASGFAQVDLCECFVIDRALTDTEVDQVNLYCARWGTPEPHLNG